MGAIARTLFGGGQQEAAQAQQQGAKEGMGAYGGFNPWIQAGQGALGKYQEGLGQMADPGAWVNKQMGSYQQSPWAKFQMQQGEQAAQQGAVAGGPAGGAEQKALERYGQGVSSKDMQNYYNNMMGAWGQYMGGEKGLAGQGLQAQGEYAPGMAGQWQDWGQAKGGEDEAKAQMWRRMFGAGEKWIGKGLRGAAMFGGGA